MPTWHDVHTSLKSAYLFEIIGYVTVDTVTPYLAFGVGPETAYIY